MQKRYRRSRASYPQGVIGVYDSGPNHGDDRYTVVYEPYTFWGETWFGYVAMSADPFHPQGFGQHGESERRLTHETCGRTISFEDLSDDCQRLVMHDLSESENVPIAD
jgi:hypothetical protein